MYCSKCGKEIDNEAVVCVHCGVATQNFNGQNQGQPIIINNSAAASAVSTDRVRRKYSVGFDVFMLIITAGLWVIWMICRPKYY